MSLVKNVQSVEEYNAAIAGEGLGKLSREQRGHHLAAFWDNHPARYLETKSKNAAE